MIIETNEEMLDFSNLLYSLEHDQGLYKKDFVDGSPYCSSCNNKIKGVHDPRCITFRIQKAINAFVGEASKA